MSLPSQKTVLDAVRLKINRCESRLSTPKMNAVRFDSVVISTLGFYRFIQELKTMSNENSIWLLVDEPDPETYFYRHFGRFPLADVGRIVSASEYISVLNRDPGDSPADAISINWFRMYIVPDSERWLIRCERRDDDELDGELLVPSEWRESLTREFSFLQTSPP